VGRALLFLFPASFLRHNHPLLAALGAAHTADIIGQDREGVIVALAAARNPILVNPGAAKGMAVVAGVQRQKREFDLAAADTDARFLVLAEFAREADKTTHGKPRFKTSENNQPGFSNFPDP
jgi:hypothetical protein